MSISWSQWTAYSWKNELKKQMERAIAHGLEALDDEFDGSHSPYDMMERAVVLSAFSVRRMIEKKSVTDIFVSSTRTVRSFLALAGVDFRQPFRSSSGGSAFINYDFSTPVFVSLTPGDIANEIIHSAQLMVLRSETFAEDGFLIASDWHQSRRLLHMSFGEFRAFAESALNDEVAFATDDWDPATGKVSALRLGTRELLNLKK